MVTFTKQDVLNFDISVKISSRMNSHKTNNYFSCNFNDLILGKANILFFL